MRALRTAVPRVTLPMDTGPGVAAYLAVCLIVAAFIRGYSGFGFSAIFVASASLVTNPVPLIPVVYICEILMTAVQARGIRGHTDWRRVGFLTLGAACTVPLAVWAIARVDGDTARLVISGIILVLALVLYAGWSWPHRIGRAGHAGVGAISGLCNGAGVGGLPVVAFLAAQPVAPRTFRATMIVYLTALDLLTLPLMYAAGLITMDTLIAVAFALPIVTMGIWLGGRRFLSADPQGFRRMAILLLLTLATLGVVRAIASGFTI